MIRSALKGMVKKVLGRDAAPEAAPPAPASVRAGPPPSWKEPVTARRAEEPASAPVEAAPAPAAAPVAPAPVAPVVVQTAPAAPEPAAVAAPEAAPPAAEPAPEAAPAARSKGKGSKSAKAAAAPPEAPAVEAAPVEPSPAPVAAEPPAPLAAAAPPAPPVEPPTDTVGPAFTFEQVQELMDEMVRPALQGDGGDITLLKVENNDVYVKLVGSCSTCPSSIMTMKMGVEALLKEEFPGMGALIQVD